MATAAVRRKPTAQTTLVEPAEQPSVSLDPAPPPPPPQDPTHAPSHHILAIATTAIIVFLLCIILFLAVENNSLRKDSIDCHLYRQHFTMSLSKEGRYSLAKTSDAQLILGPKPPIVNPAADIVVSAPIQLSLPGLTIQGDEHGNFSVYRGGGQLLAKYRHEQEHLDFGSADIADIYTTAQVQKEPPGTIFLVGHAVHTNIGPYIATARIVASPTVTLYHARHAHLPQLTGLLVDTGEFMTLFGDNPNFPRIVVGTPSTDAIAQQYNRNIQVITSGTIISTDVSYQTNQCCLNYRNPPLFASGTTRQLQLISFITHPGAWGSYAELAKHQLVSQRCYPARDLDATLRPILENSLRHSCAPGSTDLIPLFASHYVTVNTDACVNAKTAEDASQFTFHFYDNAQCAALEPVQSISVRIDDCACGRKSQLVCGPYQLL